MALLIEQNISCLADWLAYDSKLGILSEQEAASVEKKGELAQREIQTEVLAFLLRNSSQDESLTRLLLDRATVTEPIKRWHIFLTLALYYADVASLQASSLHRDQSRYFELKADEARDQTYATGVGIVDVPVARGQVPEILSSNTEDSNRLIRARVKFQNAAGIEGSPSEEFSVRIPTTGNSTLRFTSLPNSVAGWRVYVSEDQSPFLALREQPYAPLEAVTIEPVYQTVPIYLNLEGQAPNRYIYLSRMSGR